MSVAISAFRLSSGSGRAAHGLGATHSQALESIYIIFRVEGRHAFKLQGCEGFSRAQSVIGQPIVFIESEVMYGDKGEFLTANTPSPSRRGSEKRRERCHHRFLVKSAGACCFERCRRSPGRIEHQHRSDRPPNHSTMDYDLIVSSVKKTNRLVIVEEGWPFAELAPRSLMKLLQEHLIIWMRLWKEYTGRRAASLRSRP